MFKIHFSGHKNILGGHCLRTPPSRGYGPDQAASLQTFCGFVCWFYEVARSRLIRCRFSVAVYCYVTNWLSRIANDCLLLRRRNISLKTPLRMRTRRLFCWKSFFTLKNSSTKSWNTLVFKLDTIGQLQAVVAQGSENVAQRWRTDVRGDELDLQW